MGIHDANIPGTRGPLGVHERIGNRRSKSREDEIKTHTDGRSDRLRPREGNQDSQKGIKKL